jgi:hypothetical protein
MENWLNGVGRVFRHPLRDSTNYLSAYNEHAELRRVRDKDEEAEVKEEEPKSQQEDDELDLDERAEAEKQFKAQAAKKRRPRHKALPPARIEDLRPFPLNRTFHSESVLSEKFREAIYLKVVEDKMTVRSVSSELGITMERVGAVVRMKQMERDWLRKVSEIHSKFDPLRSMMIPFKNRLVFKTTTWLQNLALRASLINVTTFLFQYSIRMSWNKLTSLGKTTCCPIHPRNPGYVASNFLRRSGQSA